MNACANTRKTIVSDRAKRYRANQAGCLPAGPRVCKLCGARSQLMVDHKDGFEENGARSNLRWLCRSCNVREGAAMARKGQGRRTVQYNPSAMDKYKAHPSSLLQQMLDVPHAQQVSAAEKRKIAAVLFKRGKLGAATAKFYGVRVPAKSNPKKKGGLVRWLVGHLKPSADSSKKLAVYETPVGFEVGGEKYSDMNDLMNHTQWKFFPVRRLPGGGRNPAGAKHKYTFKLYEHRSSKPYKGSGSYGPDLIIFRDGAHYVEVQNIQAADHKNDRKRAEKIARERIADLKQIDSLQAAHPSFWPNPTKEGGAANLFEYVLAGTQHTRGAHDEGGRIIHNTPKSKRREFAAEIWAKRSAGESARGRSYSDEPDWVTNPQKTTLNGAPVTVSLLKGRRGLRIDYKKGAGR